MIDKITAAAQALGLGISNHQATLLQQYLELLQRWNTTYNLTAIRDPQAMLDQHVADCLACIQPLQRQGTPARVLDVGSGGGLPAVVIAVMLPASDVTAVDAVGKKMAFVRQVAGTLGLQNLHGMHCRVEDLKAPAFDVIISRAFASLTDFVRLTQQLLKPGGAWVAMKGRTPDDELQALPATIDVFHVEQLAVPGLDAQRCLVWMRPRAD